jgi:putative FmdB family regulatory protein
MPTYEYECAKCGKTFDFFQSMKDEHLKTCINKKCKGKVKRLLGTGAGLIFKGSGFYITDYRSEGYKQAAKKDTPGGGEATKSGGGEAAKSGGGESSPSPSSGGEKPKAEKSKPTKSK